MILLNILLLAANLVAFVLMWRFGDKPERYAVALVVTALVAGVFAQDWVAGSWRFGVALVNLALFLGLWGLAERSARWWLIGAAGLQLVSVLTHLLPLMTHENLVNTGVIARKAVWFVISGLFFIAAWEAWADRLFRLERRIFDAHKTHGTDGGVAPPTNCT